MTFFDNIQTRIAALDEKTWYQYLAIAAGVLLLMIGLILYFYFSSVSKWKDQITEINEQRLEAKRLLDKAEKVYKERAEVTAILAEDPNFKIKEYIQDVLEKIGIFGNVNAENVVIISRADRYQEHTATYQINGITMKQLTEFLNEIDENKRVFTKELDISKSKKIPRTIDVDIKISTLMPKETT